MAPDPDLGGATYCAFAHLLQNFSLTTVTTLSHHANPCITPLSYVRHSRNPGALKVVGAHDALSARLIERAGFDGVWASGFAISASLKCIPDASFITSSEQLEVERNIAEAVNIPVIADCDTGYGNALNVMRTVNDRERAGVAAICIEDNVYPKRCSFYAGVRRELIPIEEHCGKIKAAKSAQTVPGFHGHCPH